MLEDWYTLARGRYLAVGGRLVCQSVCQHVNAAAIDADQLGLDFFPLGVA